MPSEYATPIPLPGAGFPDSGDLYDCPHCKGKNCQFLDGNHSCIRGDTVGSINRGSNNIVHVRFCTSCNRAIIRSVSKSEDGSIDDKVYPLSTSRPTAREELEKEDPGLAKDYNEAVACELGSEHATASLLGRCVERILVAKCGVEHKITNQAGKVRYKMLGAMIPEAIKHAEFPTEMRDALQKGFAVIRNQASHPWKDEQGEDLNVDKKTVDRCFGVVNYLIHRFYIMPLELKKLETTAQATEKDHS